MSISPAAGTPPWILVLDVGSSSVRATLFDAAGRSLPPTSEMRRRYRWSNEPPDAMECDAELLLHEVVRTIDAAAEQIRSEGVEVAAVAIAAFWHSLMGVDAAGRPATPVFGWGDTRARDVALALRDAVDERALHRRTGCFLHPSYPVVKLAWLRRDDPAAFARSAAWISFPEYLDRRLLGLRRCSTSMASGSGLLDVHLEAWSEEALELAAVGAEQLSPLVGAGDAGRLSTEFATRWPELSDIPWFPALGDGACANAGSAAVGPGRPGLTIGTSAAVRALWEPEGPVRIPEELWCYRLDSRWWVAGGALSNGGNAVAWLRRTLSLGAREELDARVEALLPGEHGLTILPFLRGERGPGWQDERSASIVGLREATLPEEILRAWMEAVAYRVARVERRLEEVVGRAAEVVASGGALQSSPSWVRILADTLDRPVAVAAEREETSRGAALLALENLGVIGGLRERQGPPARVFEPDPAAHAVHAEAMRRQQRLLEFLAPGLAADPRQELDSPS